MTSLDPGLMQLLDEGLKSTEEHANHELILPLRRRIWAQLGEHRSQAGIKRRYRLAKQCVEKVLPIWEASFTDNRSPHRLLQQCDLYLDSGSVGDRDVLNLQCDKFSMFLDANMVHPDQTAQYVGSACFYAARIIIGDDVAPRCLSDFEELDDDIDPFSWDSSYYAAAAYAGELPVDPDGSGNEDCDKKKLKEFWQWYLTVAVPSVFQK